MANFRTNSRRFMSHKITSPSAEADKKVLKDLDNARTLTGLVCPKRVPLGFKSTDFGPDMTDQTDMVQSAPAVISVLESTKIAHESCPTWRCSKRPTS